MVTIVLAGGSADRGETVYSRAAFEFGERVARAGWTLRTGGGSGHSIMGAASDGALKAGGRVEGVILRRFWKVRHRGLTSLRSCRTFAHRKAELFEGADAGVIFPGGFGTLDELGDLLCLKQNGFARLPIILADVEGYYKTLLRWMDHAHREGFLYGDSLFEVASTPVSIVRRLRSRLNGHS
jgi:uncharacterized protein (TIGR00730 family)